MTTYYLLHYIQIFFSLAITTSATCLFHHQVVFCKQWSLETPHTLVATFDFFFPLLPSTVLAFYLWYTLFNCLSYFFIVYHFSPTYLAALPSTFSFVCIPCQQQPADAVKSFFTRYTFISLSIKPFSLLKCNPWL